MSNLNESGVRKQNNRKVKKWLKRLLEASTSITEVNEYMIDVEKESIIAIDYAKLLEDSSTISLMTDEDRIEMMEYITDLKKFAESALEISNSVNKKMETLNKFLSSK